MKKAKEKKKDNSDGSMSVTGHLKELRNRIIIILAVLVVGIVLCFSYAETIVKLLTDISDRFGYNFVYIKPQELLMVYFSISLIGSIVVCSPVIAYEIYAFCSPGLKKKERSFVLMAFVFGFSCFAAGVFFAYKIMLPFMLKFLISFSTGTAIKASITIQEYVSFLLLIFIIFGLIFELPVISVLLTSLGIIKPEWLVKARKVMIVAIFFIAAVITPPDIVSQIMVAVPIIALYELSIVLSRAVYKLKKKEEYEEDSSEDEDGEEE